MEKRKSVASLASISKTINYAVDGIHFSVIAENLTDIPKATGLYRPDLEDSNRNAATPGWGIAMKVKKGEAYLVRFEMK